MELEFEAIKQFFLDEASELFEKIDGILLSSEQAGKLQSDDIDSLFRFFHTLKGNSATVGLKTSAKITHELESFLAKLKNGSKDTASGVLSMLVDSVEMVKMAVFTEVEDALKDDEANKIIDFIAKAVNGNFSEQDKNESEFKEQTQAPKESAKEQNQIRVDLSKVD
ncbi:MAG TPA: Hpt domain-containing protein, partial [Campylobacterales bacterium]|nr:Hpt domain-containing protein [Campylobacterales bacterium]